MSTATTHIKTDKQLVPALRFDEFEGDWEKKKLGEVSNFLDGRRKPIKSGDRAKMQGEYPYYGASGIIDYVNNYIFDEELILLGEDGENIVSRNSPLAFRVSGKCWINNHAHVIVPKEGIDIDFLTHNLERINYLIYNTGTAQPKLNQEVCRSIPSYFASYPEQQKIASFLSSVDEKIQQLTKKKELLEQYKIGVMQQLFSGQLRFKDENGNPYPDWEEKRLGEIGKTFNGLTGKTKEDFGEGKPYIQYMQIFRGSKINPNEFGFVKLNENEKQSRAQFGDAFFTTSSEIPKEIGTASVLLDEIEELYLNSFCFGYRPDNLELIVPQFLQFLLRSEVFRRKIIPLAQGSTRYNMSKIELMKLKIDIPHNEEQQKIATYLSRIDTKIESVNNQITQTQTFKKGLLQQLFI